MALDAAVRGLVSSSPDSPDVSGIVVDVPGSGGFASIVALADGTTSMYTSMRLHVLTPTGGRHVDVPEDAFWGRQDHALMPVIARVQDVITAISTASPPGA